MGAKKPETPPKKLVIIGTAGNRDKAPIGTDYTIWGTGGIVNAPDVKRTDACFELHPERWWKRPEVLPVIQAYPGIVYMQDHYEEIPNSVKYPIEDARETFYLPTMGKALYATNTVAFMFMMAYLEGFTEVETWGVYMEHETEYVHQRLNCEYYLGFLAAKGVKLTINGGDVLKASFTYGYEEPGMWVDLIGDKSGLEKGKEELKDEVDKIQRRLWMQEGALKYNADLRKKFGGY